MSNSTLRTLVAVLFSVTLASFAGPPFLTDDPAPVDYQQWEFYVASQHAKSGGDWSGTAPHLELNYGPATNVMLHLIAPMVYDSPSGGPSHYGYGDTELGVKWRFIEETEQCPQVGIFPLMEIPTGNSAEGLGSGHVQAFLPVWVQKSFGEWTTYGGGGYGINPGADNKNWGFVGAVLQRQITDGFILGGEIYHRTKTEAGGEGDTGFNIGTVVDFTEHHHLLFSAGSSIDGPTDFQCYIAWQFTFGPEFFQSVGNWFRQ